VTFRPARTPARPSVTHTTEKPAMTQRPRTTFSSRARAAAVVALVAALAPAIHCPAQSAGKSKQPAAKPATKAPSKQPASAPAAQPASAADPSTAEAMRGILTPKDEAARVRLVRALRALKDPALAPVFTSVSAAKSAPLRAEAILALAELEPARGVDLLLVKKLDARHQAYVLSTALDAGLLPSEQLEDLARWTDLQPGIYISVASRLVASGKRVEVGRLKQAAAGDDPIVAAVAGVLLLQSGQADGSSKPLDAILASKERGSSDAIRRVLGVIRDRQLPSGVPFARAALARATADPLLRYEAAATLLVVEPSGERVASLLAGELAAASDTADRVRLALAAAFAAIERDAGLPASAIAPLAQDRDELVSTLGKCLEALAAKTSPVEPMVRLAARRNTAASQWVLRAAKRLPTDQARAVRLAIISHALSGDGRAVEDLAADAATALAADDPAILRDPLLAAIDKRDTPTCVGILTGVLRAGKPAGEALTALARPIAAAGDAPPWPSARVEAVALLVRARFAEKLPKPDVERLGSVARGAGGLPEIACTQAAWMTLKALTDDRAALSRLLADLAK